MNFGLRRAVPGDAPTLAVLAERTFRDAFGERNSPSNMDLHCERHFGPDIQAREISERTIVTTLAIASGQLIGFTQLMPSRPQPLVPAARRPAELNRIYVVAGWQGKGVAQALLRDAITSAKSARADWLWLGVWEHNPKAIAFYRKSGFEEAGSHSFMLGEERQRDVVMSIRLG
jgi:ribosomal protein S18 acetylase RimI-like enzyme